MKTKISILIIILIQLITSGILLFSQQTFTPGTKAPDITISKWLNYTPSEKDPFTGKTVILEFWGTWCRPCIMTIPHLNELVTKNASDSIIFVSMSKEKIETVSNFLKNKELKSFVCIDAEGKTNNNFKIQYIPKAFIIDSYGKIAWEGHPASLTGRIIQDIAQKKHTQK